jgi:protein-tyrosine phosphatase
MDWWSRRPDDGPRSTRGRFSRPSVSEITEYLLVGEYPRLEDVAWLRSEFGVTAIHNLQDEIDLQINGLDAAELRSECDRLGLKFVHTPIHDGSADDMAVRLTPALHALAALIEAGERVFLHCNGGVNRAPTVAIGWLRESQRWSLDEAMTYFKRRRPCGPFMTVLEGHFGPRHLRPGS